MLFALGFSGNSALSDTLTPYLSSDDPLEARLAAQSLGLIFGFSPAADEFSVAPPEPPQAGELPPPEADPEAQTALPALEDDDLDADLVPAPEEALPSPNTEAIVAFCERTARALSTKQRVLWGQPISAQQTARVLSEGPLRVRHYLALAHGVRSGGSIWLDTCARTAVQQSSVARVAASSVQRFVGF